MEKQRDENAPPPPPPPLLPPCNSLNSRKRLLATPERNARTSQGASPSSSSLSIQSRHPNISKCHSCGSRINPKGGKDKLRIPDSQWRIVLLCNNCFKDVQSAKSCSYCFLRISDEARVSCGNCSRCVHKGCIFNCNGACSWSCSDSFTCFDCWVPRSKSKTCCSGVPDEGVKVVADDCSVKKSEGLADDGHCSRSMEDMAKEAEVKVAAAARARDNACKKDAVARRAAAAAAVALDLVRVDSNEEVQTKDSLLISNSGSVENGELEYRLRCAINSSPRIFKNLCSENSDPLVALKKWNFDGHLSSNKSDPGSSNVRRKLEYCASVVLGLPAPRKKMKSGASSQKKRRMEIGVDGKMGNFECEKESSLRKIPDGKDNSAELPVKEGQSCSSSKPSDHSRDEILIDAQSCDTVFSTLEEKRWDKPDMFLLKYSKRTQCHSSTCNEVFSTSKEKRKDGPDMYLLKYSKRVQCQSSCAKVLSTFEEKRFDGSDMYLLKYSKRPRSSKAVIISNGTYFQSSCDKDSSTSQQKICQVPDMYFYKYKRHKSSSDRQTKFSYEDFPLGSRHQQLEFSCCS